MSHDGCQSYEAHINQQFKLPLTAGTILQALLLAMSDTGSHSSFLAANLSTSTTSLLNAHEP